MIESKGWLVVENLNAPEFHGVPKDDLVEHEMEDCVCGTDVEVIKKDNGAVWYYVTHHSLDGRERFE